MNDDGWNRLCRNAHSSSGAECRSIASTTIELTWISFLLRENGIPLQKLAQLFCDNASALHMSFNPMFHAGSKYIELEYHLVREKVATSSLVTRYISYGYKNHHPSSPMKT